MKLMQEKKSVLREIETGAGRTFFRFHNKTRKTSLRYLLCDVRNGKVPYSCRVDEDHSRQKTAVKRPGELKHTRRKYR